MFEPVYTHTHTHTHTQTHTHIQNPSCPSHYTAISKLLSEPGSWEDRGVNTFSSGKKHTITGVYIIKIAISFLLGIERHVLLVMKPSQFNTDESIRQK